jgi:hypothetical protein
MTDMTELGSNIATPLPPPPPETHESPRYAMSPDEPYTREQFHASGWTDAQLIAAGKMSVITVSTKVDMTMQAPIGMPESTWIILDENADIPPTGLFVGHNGEGFLIRPAEPVLVPNKVLRILDDAIMEFPVTDGANKVIGYRPRRRYSYQRVAAPLETA